MSLVLICGVLGLTGCGALGKAKELTAYEFGDDSIPTVNSVVGERKVTGVSSGSGTGGTYQEYTYVSETAAEDLSVYLSGIAENGWTPTTDIDLANIPGTAQLAIESKDSGKVIVIDVTYDQSGYTIKLTKRDGTLTVN